MDCVPQFDPTIMNSRFARFGNESFTIITFVGIFFILIALFIQFEQVIAIEAILYYFKAHRHPIAAQVASRVLEPADSSGKGIDVLVAFSFYDMGGTPINTQSPIGSLVARIINATNWPEFKLQFGSLEKILNSQTPVSLPFL